MFNVITIWLQKNSYKVTGVCISPSHHIFSRESGCQLSNKVKRSPSVVTGVGATLSSLLFYSSDERKCHRKSMDAKQSPSVVSGVDNPLPSLLFYSSDERKCHRKSMDAKQSPSVVTGEANYLSSLLFYFKKQKIYLLVTEVRTSISSLIYDFLNRLFLTIKEFNISPIVCAGRKKGLI